MWKSGSCEIIVRWLHAQCVDMSCVFVVGRRVMCRAVVFGVAVCGVPDIADVYGPESTTPLPPHSGLSRW